MKKRIDLFPISTTIENDSLKIANTHLAKLAGEYGTPLYIYDKATLDSAAAGYKATLGSSYPGPASVTYAGKAFLNRSIAQWVQSHGMDVDCTGEGEIAIAVAGGVTREHILVHGVNKSKSDLHSALEHAGTIVVDNLTELKNLESDSSLSNLRKRSPALQIWLRLLPGVAVSTHHAHTQTGQHDSKFGMIHEEIVEAAMFCKKHNLPLNGIHFHQGSNFRDPNPLIEAIQLGLEIANEIGFGSNWHFSPGGGWGVAYHEDELPQPDIAEYVRMISENVIKGCKARGLHLPRLHLEPGRSLVARAGVAIYRVGAIKRRGDKVWVLTDGGMTDNPRHAMYGARYSCLPVSGVSAERTAFASIAGPYCESGDVVIEDLPMPNIQEGDLLAIPVSGAYHLSMSSNYNGARRPAVLMLENGNVKLMQRRETIDDLLARDIIE